MLHITTTQNLTFSTLFHITLTPCFFSLNYTNENERKLLLECH